jgi:hypothetical protein
MSYGGHGGAHLDALIEEGIKMGTMGFTGYDLSDVWKCYGCLKFGWGLVCLVGEVCMWEWGVGWRKWRERVGVCHLEFLKSPMWHIWPTRCVSEFGWNSMNSCEFHVFVSLYGTPLGCQFEFSKLPSSFEGYFGGMTRETLIFSTWYQS